MQLLVDYQELQDEKEAIQAILRRKIDEGWEAGTHAAMTVNQALIPTIALRACIGKKPLSDNLRHRIMAEICGLKKLDSIYSLGWYAASAFAAWVYQAPNLDLNEIKDLRAAKPGEKPTLVLNWIYDSLCEVKS